MPPYTIHAGSDVAHDPADAFCINLEHAQKLPSMMQQQALTTELINMLHANNALCCVSKHACQVVTRSRSITYQQQVCWYDAVEHDIWPMPVYVKQSTEERGPGWVLSVCIAH